MRFVEPQVLWLLLLLPVGALLSFALRARRRRLLARFAGGPAHLDRFTGEVSGHRRAVKLVLLGVALAASIVALARPQWGARLEPIRRSGVDVMIVLDTSLSMAAEDLPPNRLDHARDGIDRLLSRLPGDRAGLVTFAGQAVLNSPLTPDHDALRLFLDSFDVRNVPVPGTSLASALKVAEVALGEPPEEGGLALVVFSDGEDHEGGIDELLATLKRRGVTVYAVGCGTERGGPIPLRDERGNLTGYKKDREDKLVTSRLDETVLRRLAVETGGRYYRATPSANEIDEIAGAIGGLDTREFGTIMRRRYEERFQIPLAVALLALLVETWLGDRSRRPSRGAAGPARRAAA